MPLERSRSKEAKKDPLTGAIIGAAITVHRTLGIGLLESVYEECLAAELVAQGLTVARQVPVPVVYRGKPVRSPLRLDLIVAGRVIVEVKCVSAIHRVHWAQLATYLRLTGLPTGLLLNFFVTRIPDGLVRMDLSRLAPLRFSASASPRLPDTPPGVSLEG
jgi:GxxExxY protein